jgi:hypothetical protein
MHDTLLMSFVAPQCALAVITGYPSTLSVHDIPQDIGFRRITQDRTVLLTGG